MMSKKVKVTLTINEEVIKSAKQIGLNISLHDVGDHVDALSISKLLDA